MTDGCLSQPLTWVGTNGGLQVNGKTFHLKGVNYYGFETEKNSLQGLDIRPINELFQFLQTNKFNALRIPFSLKFALDYDSVVGYNFKDAEFNGMTKRQLLNRVVEKAAEYKMLVLLDMHRLNDAVIPQLWYSDEYPMDDVLKGWDTVLGDLKKHWNVFGVDLKNEPHGEANWGSSSPNTNWNLAAQDIGKHILVNHADWKGLIFVEGINYSTDFRGILKHPIDFGKPEWNQRLILSPHQYGPSVTNSALFQQPAFPENLPAEWTAKWAFMQAATENTVVLGEWGGRYQDKDKAWQDRFSEFLLEKCLNDQFTWDLNPTSSDTGGLLKDDWYTPETEKLEVVARVQPDPSFLSQNAATGQICMTAGSFARAECAR